LILKSDLSEPIKKKRAKKEDLPAVVVLPPQAIIRPKYENMRIVNAERARDLDFVGMKGQIARNEENKSIGGVVLGKELMSGCQPTVYWWQCRFCWHSVDMTGEAHHKECQHCHRWKSQELKAAWGGFINETLKPTAFTPEPKWDWFVTITFRDPPAWLQNKGWTQIGWAYAWKAWFAFVFWMQHHIEVNYGCNYDFSYFVVMEGQERGVPHLHALFHHPALAQDEDLMPKAFRYLWNRNGYNKIYRFNEHLGAEYYVAKYMSKSMMDWVRYTPPDPEFRLTWEEKAAKNLWLFPFQRPGDGLHGQLDSA